MQHRARVPGAQSQEQGPCNMRRGLGVRPRLVGSLRKGLKDVWCFGDVMEGEGMPFEVLNLDKVANDGG